MSARDPLDWLLLASLIALAFNTHGAPVPLAAFLILVGLAFLNRTIVRRWQLWASIAVVQGIWQIVSWEGIDDHVIVGTYWAIAVALGLWAGRPEETLARSGRWMVGLIFFFAAGWKIAMPEFGDGSFFTLYLVADPRFQPLAQWVGGVGPEVMEANRQAIGRLFEVGSGVRQVTLSYGDRLEWLARGMSWWGIAIESSLALAWLSPLRGGWIRIRHGLLLVFVATTYGVVAITGFGAILLVMGLATSDSTSWRPVYYVALGVLIVWTPLWRLIVL